MYIGKLNNIAKHKYICYTSLTQNGDNTTKINISTQWKQQYINPIIPSFQSANLKHNFSKRNQY